MPRTSIVGDAEKGDILVALKVEGATYQSVARLFDRDPDTISKIAKEFAPTKVLASAKLQSKLSTLVDRVLEKADVDQIIDILSRPNIGILEPHAKPGSGAGNNFGIMVSVNTGSLAAVADVASLAAGQAPVPVLEGEIAGKNVRVGPVQVAQHSVTV